MGARACNKSLSETKYFVLFIKSVATLKKVKREAAAQRRPAKSERKNRAFSAKRQAVYAKHFKLKML